MTFTNILAYPTLARTPSSGQHQAAGSNLELRGSTQGQPAAEGWAGTLGEESSCPGHCGRDQNSWTGLS